MELSINSSLSNPISRLKIPIFNSINGYNRNNRVDLLDLDDLYNEEKIVAPLRVYGTLNYISPLSGITASPTKKEDLFRKETPSFDHLNTFKPHIAKLLNYTETTQGFQEVLEIIDTPNTIDFVRPTQFCANIYGEPIWNFVLCDDSVSGVTDDIYIYYSTTVLEKRANIYGGVFDYVGGSLVSDKISYYSIGISGGNSVDYSFNPINRYTIDKTELAYNGGFVYKYISSNLTIKPDNGYALDCLYSDYKLVELEKTDYKPDETLNENC